MAEADPAIEVDTRATENDSTYGDELFATTALSHMLKADPTDVRPRSSYSASLTSSVLDYRRENGRRYHGYREGKYLMPNDEEESNRLDMMHEMMLSMMDRKLFLAPVAGDSPQRVLDLGTGTGIWPVDVGDQYPSAEVIGVDLSPIQPTLVPPNVRFLVDDIEADWVYDRPFDLIHARYLAASVRDYKSLIRQADENTSPGGWLEIHDWDCTLRSEDGSTSGTSIQQYYAVVLDAFQKIGYEPNPGPLLEAWYREAGFEKIHVEKFMLPLGGWPRDEGMKTTGLWNLFQAETGFESAAMAILTRNEGWSKDEVTVLVAKTNSDARNPRIHPYFDFYAVYGQKPSNAH